ncbi:hypothetical protein STEG23_036105, partial [Scotinomys teguina]
MCRLSWFLDPGGWSKTAVVGLYFIFPGICTLSLELLVEPSHDELIDRFAAVIARLLLDQQARQLEEKDRVIRKQDAFYKEQLARLEER